MKMKTISSIGAFCVAVTVGAVAPANAAKEKTYTLGGFTFSGFADVNTDEIAAKLKDQPGARITQADIAIDENMFIAELKARNIKGRLLATTAEKHGTVWLIFDLQHPRLASPLYYGRPLNSQAFEGDIRLPAGELAAATGLRTGESISLEKIRAAHDGLVALYEKSAPGKAPIIRSRAKVTSDGQVSLVWLIGEQ